MDADTATLIPLDQVDPSKIEGLLDRAFEPERHTRTAYKVREGTAWLPGLSFAAIDENERLVGSLQTWPVALTDPDGRAHPLLMVGPVAVLPERQGEGFGTALMLAMLTAIDDLSSQGGAAPLPQVMIGDEPYYSRFGFSAGPAAGWSLPGPWDPRRLLVRAIDPSVLPTDGMLGPWLR